MVLQTWVVKKIDRTVFRTDCKPSRVLAYAKTTKQAAEAKLKLTGSESKNIIEKTSVADWERNHYGRK